MPRISRKDLETSFFHVVVHGINKEYIFKNRKYKEKFKSLLMKFKDINNVKILAYCIMDNHAHVLMFVEKTEDMSKFMKSVNEEYGRYYNKMEDRSGFVFRNRYLSEPIYAERHLFMCISYIHMNPVKVHIVETPEKYEYSSYNEYLHKRGIITDEILVLLFGTTKNYMEIFLTLSTDESDFIDYDKIKKNPLKEINNYCIANSIQLHEIIVNKNELSKLVRHLVVIKKISIKETSYALGIHRLKVSRLL